MAKGTSKRSTPTPRTVEGRESQMTSLAFDLAEQKLRDGTASNTLILHYLKIGSTKEKIEKEILEKQSKLLDAKTEAYESNKRIEELYTDAIRQMKKYQGVDEYEE